MTTWLRLLFLALALAAAAAPAATLRIASGQDPQTMDPHGLALLYQTRVLTQVYEGLVDRSRDFSRLEPALALGWEQVGPTTWRFRLRPGVHFHDGSLFTADDAVFSIARALSRESQRANQMRGITGARKVDAMTIEVLTEAPDALLPEKLWLVAMMSRDWCRDHHVEKPQDYNAHQETFAVRNANGTGPFSLVRYEADVRTVLKAHAGWWGRDAAAAGPSAIDEVHFVVIGSDATRLAALQSGQVDLVLDPPLQDLARLKSDERLKLMTQEDIGTQYLALDQHSDALPGVPGRNPFKDARVRRAVQLAIDADLLVRQVLRGEGTATGSFVSPLLDGYVASLEKRPAADAAAARDLLRQAGYAEGFTVAFDCVSASVRAATCQAMAAMLDKVGIHARLQLSPSATFFPKLTQATTPLAEFGWSPNTDPWNVLHSLLHTHDGVTAGAFNAGRYTNPRLDALIDAIRVEPDLAIRRAKVAQALALVREEMPLVPLYRRHHVWVMRREVSVVQWPSDYTELRWAAMRPR